MIRCFITTTNANTLWAPLYKIQSLEVGYQVWTVLATRDPRECHSVTRREFSWGFEPLVEVSICPFERRFWGKRWRIVEAFSCSDVVSTDASKRGTCRVGLKNQDEHILQIESDTLNTDSWIFFRPWLHHHLTSSSWEAFCICYYYYLYLFHQGFWGFGEIGRASCRER